MATRNPLSETSTNSTNRTNVRMRAEREAILTKPPFLLTLDNVYECFWGRFQLSWLGTLQVNDVVLIRKMSMWSPKIEAKLFGGGLVYHWCGFTLTSITIPWCPEKPIRWSCWYLYKMVAKSYFVLEYWLVVWSVGPAEGEIYVKR